MMTSNNHQFCRLCADLTPNENIIKIHTHDTKCTEVSEKLERINAFIDFNDDTLPKRLCLVCEESLNHAYEFVLKIERSQEQLRSIFLYDNLKDEVNDDDQVAFQHEDCIDNDDEPIEPDFMKIEDETTLCNVKEEFKVNTRPNQSRDSPKDETCKKGIKKKILQKSKRKNPKQETKSESCSESPLEQSWFDYIWKCAICDTQFNSFDELKAHSSQYHNICNAFRCVDCNIRKLRLDRFLIHVRRHRNYLKAVCFKCDTRFPTQHRANIHHTEHKMHDHICPGCHAEFPNIEELNKHTFEYYQDVIRKRFTPLEEKITDKLTCLLCKKTFKHRGHLSNHLLRHTMEERKKDHTCDRCGKCYATKIELTEHLMKHDNIRPFACKICNKAFFSQRHLGMHIGVHDNAKPFSCEQCGRCFRLRRQLTSHKIIHTDSLPYACTVCDKRFRFRALLNQHNRQHTGVKPYSCEICQRDFTNWPNYNKHMKRRHNLDMAKKKRTPEGICPINPATGEVITFPQTKEVEWKKEIKKRRVPQKKDSTAVTDTTNPENTRLITELGE